MSEPTDDRSIHLTPGELENIRAAERVQTSLMVLIDDFKDHKIDDKTEFHTIGQILSRVEKGIQEFPARMQECQRDTMEISDKKFVSRKELRAGFLALAALQVVFGFLVWFQGNSLDKVSIARSADRFTATDAKQLEERLHKEIQDAIKNRRNGH